MLVACGPFLISVNIADGTDVTLDVTVSDATWVVFNTGLTETSLNALELLNSVPVFAYDETTSASLTPEETG